ncbi:MAG: Crp/Fnr family transcriptional regulator [bacterium]|nr:Crp/Fnr family transcriptional regulator [bacterium]
MSEETKIIQHLEAVKAFEPLSADGRLELARNSQWEDYAKNDFVIFEGDENDWLFSPAKGRLKLVKHLDTGRDVILSVIVPGEIVGEGPVYDGKTQPASLQAMEDASVVRIRRPALVNLLKSYPDVLESLISHESSLLRDTFDQVKSLSGERVKRRVASVILKLAAKAGELLPDDTVRINLRVTRQDIANMAGSTVETTIRTISKITSDGILDTKNGHIIIKDRHGLVEIAENIGD